MIDKDDYFKTLKELIAGVTGDERTPDDIYEARLQTCVECDRLLDGMCRGCGCFVELRAVIKTNDCPYGLWEKKI